MLHNYLAGQSTYHNLKKKWTDFRIPVRCPDQTCSIDILIQKSLLTFLKSSIWSFEHFQFSTNFLSDMILQCMTIYLYWEKPVWLWCQYWIRPNIAVNTKNAKVSQNDEKSSYRTNCSIFIITVFNLNDSKLIINDRGELLRSPVPQTNKYLVNSLLEETLTKFEEISTYSYLPNNLKMFRENTVKAW